MSALRPAAVWRVEAGGIPWGLRPDVTEFEAKKVRYWGKSRVTRHRDEWGARRGESTACPLCPELCLLPHLTECDQVLHHRWKALLGASVARTRN
jgi:hypothetical protein